MLIASVVLIVMYLISKSWDGETALSNQFARLFDINGEANVSAWYASFLWTFASFRSYDLYLLSRSHARSKRHAPYWLALSVVCIYLAIDETAMIHETIGSMIGQWAVGGEGIGPVYDWVWFGMAMVAAVGLAFLRFLTQLPFSVVLGFLISGAVFLTGAIFFETLGSLVQSQTLSRFPLGLTWTGVIALEEFMELAGVCMFVAVLRLHACEISCPP